MKTFKRKAEKMTKLKPTGCYQHKNDFCDITMMLLRSQSISYFNVKR